MSNSLLQIRDLARLVHDKSNPWKLMALLRAFFDESGLHGKSPITGIAGFIGPSEEWEAVEVAWGAELERFRETTGHKINVYHATDCNSGEGPCFGIKNEIRESYNSSLARTLIGFTKIKGFAVSIETEAWNRLASNQFKERYKSPYQLCAENCFQQIGNYSRVVADNNPVALTFAEHNSYSRNISEVFSHYLSNKTWANIKSLSFVSPADCICLQSADMISYESFRYWKNFKEKGTAPFGDRAAFEILAGSGHFDSSVCYDDTGIRNAVKQYHVEEQLPSKQ